MRETDPSGTQEVYLPTWEKTLAPCASVASPSRLERTLPQNVGAVENLYQLPEGIVPEPIVVVTGILWIVRLLHQHGVQWTPSPEREPDHFALVRQAPVASAS